MKRNGTSVAEASKNKKLKPGWRMVRFDGIAENITDRVDDPSQAGVDRYVGLEHLDPESLKIRRWGVPTDVEATKLRFRPGDIIFGKRRAYQRKLAMADFEGICSAHALVLRPRKGVAEPSFLPFFMQSELFFGRALAISVGSLSPTINWSALARQEFPFPPISAQQRMAEQLWAAVDTENAYLQVVERAAALYQAAVDEQFSPLQHSKCGVAKRRYDVVRLEEITTKIVDGVHKRPEYVQCGIPFITVENLTHGQGIDFEHTRFITAEDHREFSKRANPERGDVLVSKDGTLGVARVVPECPEFSIFVSVALLKPDRTRIMGEFLRAYFDSTLFRGRIDQKTSGSALKHIHLTDFRSMQFPLPSMSDQEKVVRLITAVNEQTKRAACHGSLARKLTKSLIEGFFA